MRLTYPERFKEEALVLFENPNDKAVAEASLQRGTTTIGRLLNALIPQEGGVDVDKVIVLCQSGDVNGLHAAAEAVRKARRDPLAEIIHPGEGVDPAEIKYFLERNDLPGLAKRARQIIQAQKLYLEHCNLVAEAIKD